MEKEGGRRKDKKFGSLEVRRKYIALKKKKKISFGKKNFGSDTITEIGPRFWFLIPKPGFGHTLV